MPKLTLEKDDSGLQTCSRKCAGPSGRATGSSVKVGWMRRRSGSSGSWAGYAYSKRHTASAEF